MRITWTAGKFHGLSCGNRTRYNTASKGRMRHDIADRARLIGCFGALAKADRRTVQTVHFVAVAENGLNGGDAGTSKFFAKEESTANVVHDISGALLVAVLAKFRD